MSDSKGQATFAGAGSGDRVDRIAARLASQEGAGVAVSFRHRWKAQDLISSGVLDETPDERRARRSVYSLEQIQEARRLFADAGVSAEQLDPALDVSIVMAQGGSLTGAAPLLVDTMTAALAVVDRG